MKTITAKIPAMRFVWMTACVILFSFSLRPGGDTYQVYMDNKLVIDQVVHHQKVIPTLPLDLRAAYEQVSVNYHHCGQVGTARTIIIKDSQENILKQWTFADTKTPMMIKVKEIATLKRNGSNRLHLYYSSKEIPEGKLLATIDIAKDNKTASK